jgi:hypothetical protein
MREDAEEDAMTDPDPVATKPLLTDATPTSWLDACRQLSAGDTLKVDDAAALQRMGEAYADKYGWDVEVRGGALHGDGAPTAGPPPYEVYALMPSTVFGFGADESFSPTRWSFEPAR